MWTHQFSEALHTADRLGLDRFATMQPEYNLVFREEERDMLPLCEKEGTGVIPYSPLAKGYLTRPDDAVSKTSRGEELADEYERDPVENYRRNGSGVEINERAGELADERGVTRAQIALSWVLHKDVVTAPIVGTSSVDHLDAAVEALDINLSDSDIEYLEEPYEAVAVSPPYDTDPRP
jgi:aryl-alcohol dehydrogenase-like predicted oxidoreductase